MAKTHSKHSVIRTIAASNTWLIGMLVVLVGIVFVVLYNFSSYKAVKAAETKASQPIISPTGTSNHTDKISNGCFILKGNFAVVQSCGVGMYRYAQYSCGDNKQIKLGSSTACKSITNWLATVSSYCTGHTSCDIKPTPKVTPLLHTKSLSHSPSVTPMYCNPSHNLNCSSGYTCQPYNDTNSHHIGYGTCVKITPSPSATTQ